MFLNQDLFLVALDKNNETFIRESLLMGAFKKSIFKDISVVDAIIEELKFGSKSFSLLNTLLLIDISVWTGDDI